MNRILRLHLVVSLLFIWWAVSGGTSSRVLAAEPSPATGSSAEPSITTSTLPAATASSGYWANLSAEGGSAPYRWAVASGSLPAGLVLDKTLGVITGVPASTGTVTFGLEVLDATGKSAERSLILSVEEGSRPATYYVDSVNGRDSNIGNSESSPWKTIAKVNSSKFAPGDRILFKREDVWQEELELTTSGEPGAPIVIDAYGSGAAPIISGANTLPGASWSLCSSCAAHIWESALSAEPNIVLFNGAKGTMKTALSQLSAASEWYWKGGKLYVWCSGNPGYSYTSGGVEAGARESGIAFFGISYVTVQNIEIAGANGLPTNGAVYAQTSTATGEGSHNLAFYQLNIQNGAADGIHLENCNGCIVEDTTVSGMARMGIMYVSSRSQFPITYGAVLGNVSSNNGLDGIDSYGCAVGAEDEGETFPHGLFPSGLIISGNTTFDNGAGIYLHWTNNSSIAANTSYDNTNTAAGGEGYGIGGEATSNNTFDGNLLYSNRTRGIELSNDSGAGAVITGSSYNLVEYNAIHNNGDHGVFVNGAPTQSNKVSYNVIWNHPNGACLIADGARDEFSGNTCWNSSIGIDLYTSESTPVTGNITIENNIIAGSLDRAVHLESGVSLSTLVIDYNDYDPDTQTTFLWPTGYGALSAWRLLGFDTHSLAAAPEFISGSPSTPSEFSIQSSSPAVGRGRTLGSPFGLGLNSSSSWPGEVLTTPQPSSWSMGAFPKNP